MDDPAPAPPKRWGRFGGGSGGSKRRYGPMSSPALALADSSAVAKRVVHESFNRSSAGMAAPMGSRDAKVPRHTSSSSSSSSSAAVSTKSQRVIDSGSSS